ncbi:MAG: VanW family protein [Thermoanaerobacterales bacterium]|nr:VanW family protein [Bacillota bacterium]MDI6906944.1 VanW family protein [Thermoanaerobacterales bacterium]
MSSGRFPLQLSGGRLVALVSLLVLVQCLVSVAAATAFLRWRYGDVILDGVRVAGVNVGGLGREEALAALRNNIPQPSRDSRLLLSTPEGHSWSLSYGELDWRLDYEGAVDEALRAGKELRKPEHLASFFRLLLVGIDLPLEHSFNEGRLRAFLEGIAGECRIEPKSAQLAFDEARITILPESVGRRLDTRGTIKEVKALDPRRYRVPLALTPVTPELTADKLRDINARLGYFITSFNPQDVPRTKNLTLAARLLNNAYVPPGAEFSLNKHLGPRTPERGYEKALLFTSNGLLRDYGGGVCQVASTLYNAVLGAGLPVTKRTGHSRPVPYVPQGRDATIYQDVLDLRFRNDRSHPILITAEIRDNKLHVGIFGHEEQGENIVYRTETERRVLKPKTIFRVDPSLPQGEMRVADPGRDGYVITTYEVKYIDNRVVQRYPIALQQAEPHTAVIYVAEADRSRYTIDK